MAEHTQPTAGTVPGKKVAPLPTKSMTINQRRWRKFKGLKRGYYSFIILVVAYILSFFLPLIVNNKALIVHFNGETYFPAVKSFFVSLPLIGQPIFGSDFYSGESLGQQGNTAEANYRALEQQFETEGGDNYVVMPLYSYGPLEDISVDGNQPFLAPLEPDGQGHGRLFGTDDRGRDVFARMVYGFQVSISFALILTLFEYIIGVPIGGMLGYFGGLFDILMQRFIEIWSTLPILFVVIIVASLIRPDFLTLVIILSLVGWIGPTVFMRAEFYREKVKDYVAAAISIGVPTRKILLKHILPNSLVPVITYFPFSIVAGITALVSLDFLGFGIPPPDPSWGQMIGIGLNNITKWWLIMVPLAAMFFTLLLTVFIGEGIREAFDPKVFSRLR